MSAASKRAEKLAPHRLNGTTVSAGCHTCPLLQQCGGYTRAGGGWSCMDRCASCDASCDLVCLKKSDFPRALLEIGGFDHRNIAGLSQPADKLPSYIPVLQHSVEGEVPLDWAAIPLPALMRFSGGRYGPLASSAPELRARLGLSSTTKLVLLGTGKDRPIESYWRWRRMHAAPKELARLGLAGAVAPNYSLFLEEPRTQHMFNRKRSLLCAAEWSAEGIGAVPYLQAVSEADWQYWESFLREHPEITVIAKEFQTGLANPGLGADTIDTLAHLQDRLGRKLHLIAIGGARFRHLLGKRFDAWTILDSVPFMKAVKRHAAARIDRSRVRWHRALGEDVGELLFHNIAQYQAWLARDAVGR